MLDYSALEPGRQATDAVRKAAADANLKADYQARLRLTGSVPIADEEFATVKEGALINGIGTVAIVLLILWLALKSARIIVAVFIALTIGLAITAALGFLTVGSLNLISVAFFVLFVGLGVDFCIQYSVRYRDERFHKDSLNEALIDAGRNVGGPLTLAAGATAAGFLAFLPTNYQGVSELGAIAGMGMIIAFLVSITLLPALLAVHQPARRKRAARLCEPRAGRQIRRAQPHSGRRRNAWRRHSRPAASVFSAFRFQSAQPSKRLGRVDLDLSGTPQGSEYGGELDQHPCQFAQGRAGDRAEDGEAARSRRAS